MLKGDTFVGKAYVVNAAHVTAYEPIRDAANTIISMLYVGIPLERGNSLRQTILSIVVSKTGFVWVLDSKGNYVISQQGKRDGENIFGAKVDNGNLFIQEIIKKAQTLKAGEIARHQYLWKNPGETEVRMKVVRFAYLKPWDWIIGAGSLEDEFLESSMKLKPTASKGDGIENP